MEAIQSYLANDPRAFSFASHHQTAKATGFLQLLPQVYFFSLFLHPDIQNQSFMV